MGVRFAIYNINRGEMLYFSPLLSGKMPKTCKVVYFAPNRRIP